MIELIRCRFPTTLWIQDAPDVGGAHLVVERDSWDQLDERARELLRWGASTSREAVVLFETLTATNPPTAAPSS